MGRILEWIGPKVGTFLGSGLTLGLFFNAAAYVKDKRDATKKEEKEKYEKSPEYRKNQIREQFSTAIENPLTEPGSPPFIKRDDIERLLLSAAHSPEGWMFIFYGPPGSGKTSYLRHSAQKLMEEDNMPVLFLEVPHVKKALNLPPEADLKEWIPKNSLIIIDQVENNDLDGNTKGELRKLAVESRNSEGHFNVIVAASEVEAAKTLLRLNGMDKIMALARTDRLTWKGKEVSEFIRLSQKCNHIRNAQEYGELAGAPGFLARMHHNSLSSRDWKQKAQEYQKNRRAFKDEVDSTRGWCWDDEEVHNDTESGERE
jgi:hypothetical protein